MSDSQLLARLVSFDSTSVNSNLPIADAICDYLDDPRITINRMASEDGQKTNLLVRVNATGGSNPDRQGLVLSGHMDVVPATEPDWRSDPFTLTETADAFVGRGACDMKGFVALAVNIAKWAADRQLRHPLVLLLTYDEEVGSFGALRMVEQWGHAPPPPRAAIIGEPTSLQLVRMHKGHLKMRITCRGRGAHSGYPHLGVSAIEPAARIIMALAQLRADLENERAETSPFFPQTPFVALNVAQVHGGSAINIIPAQCTVDVGLRSLPGMDPKTIADRVQETIESVKDRGDCVVEVAHNNPPMLLSENSETYRRFATILNQKQCVGVSYATDAGILQELDLDCVIWGPGTIEVAHKPNESMPKGEFSQARKMLEQLVTECCS